MNPLHYSHHEGISCDHCMKSNFRGKRFKCLVCPDYDLCASCYESGIVPAGKRHTSEHPVQCILTRNDYEVYFGGEQNQIEQIQSFTCPICGKMGYTENLLYDHSMQEHSDTFTQVTCPICCTMQNVEPVLTIEDFTSHLSIEHRSGRGYDTPQAQAQALRGRRAPHTNRTGVNQTRNHRRQITPSTVTMLSNINPLLNSLPHDQGSNSQISQIRDLDPITELLSQLRRSQTANQSSLSSNNFTNASSNPLHLDRNGFRGNALRQVFDRPATDIVVRRHNQTTLNQQPITQTNLSQYGVGLSYLLMDTLSNQPTNVQTNSTNLANQGTNPPSSSQFQFLLSTCKENPKISKELEDSQRVDKSLFLQELLISSIENFFKHDLKFKRNVKSQIGLTDEHSKVIRASDQTKQHDDRPNDKSAEHSNDKPYDQTKQTEANDQANNDRSSEVINNQTNNKQNELNGPPANESNNESNQATIQQSQPTNQVTNHSTNHNNQSNAINQMDESISELVASNDLKQDSMVKLKDEASNEPTNDETTK